MNRSPRTFRPESLLAHREWVERAARALVHGDADAADVQQQAWLKALTRPPIREPNSPRGWLWSVLKNAAIDASRSSATRRHHERAASRPERIDASPADLVVRAETLDRVAHAVLELEEPYRATVLLRYFDDLDPRAIAELQGIPVETVRTRLKRAVIRLRERLNAGSEEKRRRGVLALLPLLQSPSMGTTVETTSVVANIAKGVVFMESKSRVAIVAAALLVGGTGLLLWTPWRQASPPAAQEFADAVHPARPDASSSAPPAVALDGPVPGHEPTLSPAPRRIASGRVVDREGRPVHRATVASIPDDLALPLDAASIEGEEGPGRSTRTGEDGEFAIMLAGGAPLHSLHVEAEGYGPAHTTGVRPGDVVSLTLEPPGVLAGRVTDAKGDPVAGAKVRVFVLIDLTRAVRETATDADGSYRLSSMPTSTGLYTLEVSAEGLATALQILPESPRPGKEVRCDVRLAQWGILRGRVVDAKTRAGIPGVRVVLCATPVTGGTGWMVTTASGGRRHENPDAWKALGETTSGSDGVFRIERLPPSGMNHGSTVFAGALGEGWTSRLIRVTPGNPGEEVQLELFLWPAAEIEGRVLEGEEPARGVTVNASVVGAESEAWFPSIYGDVPLSWGTTNDEGRYRLRGVPVTGSGPAVVEVRAYARSVMFQDATPARPGALAEAEVLAGVTSSIPDLVLPGFRAAAADIVVVDETGNPIGGAELTAPEILQSPRTDAEGRARLHWAPGDSPQPSRSVIVRARGFGPVAVTVTPHEDAPPLVRVVLGEGFAVRGTVRGFAPVEIHNVAILIANGSLAPEEAFRQAFERSEGRYVATFPPLRTYAMARPDGEGRFQFNDLPDGPYFLKAILYLPGDPARSLPAQTRESPILAFGHDQGEATLEIPPDGR